MKRILITGAGSFVGQGLARYLQAFPDDFEVTAISVRDEAWKKLDFGKFDVIYHTAGIVHQEKTKQDASCTSLYESVNTALPFALAQKAKAEGVEQFIFLSTAAVYGADSPLGTDAVITKTTPIAPKDLYGKSKWEAEKLLTGLADDHFCVTILRPPMIYGAGCKGNYNALAKLARTLPFFPAVSNRHFMIYIDNLSELVRLLIIDGAGGVFCPQNLETASTDRIVSLIAAANGRKILMVPGFGWALKLLGCFTSKVEKAFGSLRYDESLRAYSQEYSLISLEDSIRLTEQKI